MLSKFILDSWSMMIEISLWLILLVAIIGGWQLNGFLGATVGLIGAFIVASIFQGVLLALDDIRKIVRAIENKK